LDLLVLNTFGTWKLLPFFLTNALVSSVAGTALSYWIAKDEKELYEINAPITGAISFFLGGLDVSFDITTHMRTEGIFAVIYLGVKFFPITFINSLLTPDSSSDKFDKAITLNTEEFINSIASPAELLEGSSHL
jgi:hypothetical protein